MEPIINILRGESSHDTSSVQELMVYFHELPEDIQNRVVEIDVHAILERSEDYQPLQPVQKTTIENNVYLALLGLVELMDFVTVMKLEAEIARDRAERINKIIESDIFAPNEDIIRFVFDDVSEQEAGKESAQTPPTQTPEPLGVIHNDVPIPQKKEREQMGHEIPLTDINKKKSEPKPDHPIVAPAPAEVKPAAKEQVLQTPVPQKRGEEDIFKKRLQQPIHTPTKESQVDEGGREIANKNPSSTEQISSDPYKESID